MKFSLRTGSRIYKLFAVFFFHFCRCFHNEHYDLIRMQVCFGPICGCGRSRFFLTFEAKIIIFKRKPFQERVVNKQGACKQEGVNCIFCLKLEVGRLKGGGVQLKYCFT